MDRLIDVTAYEGDPGRFPYDVMTSLQLGFTWFKYDISSDTDICSSNHLPEYDLMMVKVLFIKCQFL